MQLVELQHSVGSDPDVALAGISYDPITVLATFSDANGIEFPLLSDVGSRVMADLGLLSDLTDEDLSYWGFEKGDRHHGLPFPGAILLDSAGVVVEKHFERSHRNRVSGGILLEALGREPSCTARVMDEVAVPGLAVRATIRTGSVFPNQIFRISLDFMVEEGRHVYVEPCPPGYQVLRISLNGPDGLFWDPTPKRSGRPFTIESLGETFSVVEGGFSTYLEAHVHETVGDLDIEIVVAYQTCDESTCDMPGELRLRLPLALLPKL